MKCLLFPFLALTLCTPVTAAPIYLTCTETKILVDSTVSESPTGVERSVGDLDDLETSSVYIDPVQGRAQIDGVIFELAIKPNEYVLRDVNRSLNSASSPGDSKLITTKLTVNRSTLSFEYHFSYLSFEKLMYGSYSLGRMKYESDKSSLGQCRITPIPPSNKI